MRRTLCFAACSAECTTAPRRAAWLVISRWTVASDGTPSLPIPAAYGSGRLLKACTASGRSGSVAYWSCGRCSPMPGRKRRSPRRISAIAGNAINARLSWSGTPPWRRPLSCGRPSVQNKSNESQPMGSRSTFDWCPASDWLGWSQNRPRPSAASSQFPICRLISRCRDLCSGSRARKRP